MKYTSLNNEYGQGMVEFILILGLVAVTLSFSIEKVHGALFSQHQELNELRAKILQPISDSSWQRQPSDAFSAQVKPVLAPLNRYTALNLGLDNLYYVASEQSPYQLARLTDGWQLDSNAELLSYPQSLTLSHYLNQVGLSNVLDVVGVLPIAKELSHDSLVLGKVDADITPYELRCVDPVCR
ncbi:MAG: hypothetical protein COA51_07450 [Idiomarina sp.]|nr:MAG: hypothetical protein COA51_07450 [Idiomarina sp.]